MAEARLRGDLLWEKEPVRTSAPGYDKTSYRLRQQHSAHNKKRCHHLENRRAPDQAGNDEREMTYSVCLIIPQIVKYIGKISILSLFSAPAAAENALPDFLKEFCCPRK